MSGRVLALCGGVGGAKLALGLYQVLEHDQLAVLVNTGDDFEHLGLHIAPDVDTVLYTLSGRVDRERGWGRGGETWQLLQELRTLGLADWFQLGDRDMALHVARNHALQNGVPLGDFIRQVARRYGLHADVWPMSDAPVRTVLDTDRGLLEFQRYFVAERAQPAVRRIEYRGADQAQPNSEALRLLADPRLDAVIICPSNPWLSIAPLLAMPALRAALAACTAPVVAVSPIVGGQAIKGPTAKIMAELGLPVSAAAVADYYGELLDGFVLDTVDAAQPQRPGLPCLHTGTVMRTDEDKRRLAGATIAFARSLRPAR